jgi:hypothetical protein
MLLSARILFWPGVGATISDCQAVQKYNTPMPCTKKTQLPRESSCKVQDHNARTYCSHPLSLGLSTSAHSTVLITRPQPARSMCGSAALVAWKVACRHTSMMALYLDRHSKGSDGGESATCELLLTCKHVLVFQACQQTNSGQEPRATLPNHKAA